MFFFFSEDARFHSILVLGMFQMAFFWDVGSKNPFGTQVDDN